MEFILLKAQITKTKVIGKEMTATTFGKLDVGQV